jgi:hypothetical protein
VVDLQGVTGSLVLNFMLQRHIFLNAGVNYSKQNEKTDIPELGLGGRNDFDRNRFFVSLRFDLPDFARF